MFYAAITVAVLTIVFGIATIFLFLLGANEVLNPMDKEERKKLNERHAMLTSGDPKIHRET